MAASKTYKNKPFAEWTEEDFKQDQADRLASFERMAEEDEKRIEAELANV